MELNGAEQASALTLRILASGLSYCYYSCKRDYPMKQYDDDASTTRNSAEVSEPSDSAGLDEFHINERVFQAGEAAFDSTDDDRWWEAWRNKNLAEAAQLRAELARVETLPMPTIQSQELIDGEWVPIPQEIVDADWREELADLIAYLKASLAALEAGGEI